MSELRANTISAANGTGPVTLTKQSAAKAWVNFSINNTPTIRNSLNTSSLTDNKSNDATINFSSSFANNDYSSTMGHTVNWDSSGVVSYGMREEGAWTGSHSSQGTSSLRIAGRFVNSSTANHTEVDVVNTTIHGDLA